MHYKFQIKDKGNMGRKTDPLELLFIAQNTRS